MKAEYRTPSMVQLRLEGKIVKDARKWWKVEDWLAKHDVDDFTETDDYASALTDFIVELTKEI